jgi:phage tail sheath protein FI
LAYTERISQPFYAPAGISRGSLNVIAPIIKLNQSDRDLLYSHNINPIASFPGQGTVVWGQKTLQQKRSALDRVNVRILINRIKKWIESYGRTVLFNNNTVNLRVIFKQNVDGYLSDIVMKNGLYAFEFIMDDTLNTADVIDRNQLIGQVKLWPTKSAEYIIIPISIEKTSTMPK